MSLGGRERKIKLVCGEGMTKQSFKEESDINNIIAGFDRTGMILNLNKKEPFYGDVSDIGDYQACLMKVQRAQELFDDLSAEVRLRFDNDPAKLVLFLSDSKNLDEAVKLGLAVKRPVEPVEAPVQPVEGVTPNVVK